MDKVKPYLEMLQKHHFWVISAIVLASCLVSWFMAASNLQAEFTKNKGEIEGRFSAMTGVKAKPDHPNDIVTASVTKADAVQAENVYNAWMLRFNEQLIVPQWPVKIYDEDFVNYINSIGPEAEIRFGMRERYRDYIKNQFAPLYKIIDLRTFKPLPERANKPNAAALAAAAAGVVDLGHEWQGLAAWSEQDRQAFESKYLSWRTVPYTRQVRYANEDLYVYNALLTIIARTNWINPEELDETKGEPIKEHLQAAIKKIEMLAIGRDVPLAEKLFEVAEALVTGEGEVVAPQPGANPQQTTEGQIPGGEVALSPEAAIEHALKDYRYVDSKGTPLPAEAPEPYAEFRIMPFQIDLFMDQRKIPALLTNCANSPLPVEVRQVMLVTGATVDIANQGANPVGIQAGPGPRPGPGPGPGPGRMIPGRGEDCGRFPGQGMQGEGAFGGGRRQPLFGEGGQPRGPVGVPGDPTQPQVNAEVEPRKYDLNVQIRGVIYIFNKPDKAKFLKGAGDAGTVPPAAAPDANAPAAVPPPAGAAPGVAAPGTVPPGTVPPGTVPPAAPPGTVPPPVNPVPPAANPAAAPVNPPAGAAP